MADEQKQIEELQNELKLLKNEIKESLVGVRDFLLTYPENPFKLDLDPGAVTVVASTVATTPAPEPRREAPPEPQYRNPEPEPNQEAEGSSEMELAAGSAAGVSAEPDDGATAEPEPTLPGPGRADERETGLSSSSAAEGDGGMAAMEPQGMPMDDLPTHGSPHLLPSNGKQTTNPVPARGALRSPEMPAEDVAASLARQPQRQADLATVAMLAPWLEDCLPRLGRTRVKALVKLYADMGGLSPECKSTIFQLIELDSHAPPKAKVSLLESLRALVELDAIIVRGRHDHTGAAILAVYLNSMARSQGGPQL